MTLDEKEKKLQERLARIAEMEQEIRKREAALQAAAPRPEEKKQVLLRLSKPLWDDIARWAEDDFRSINGQIEYLLSEAVKRRKSQ